MIDEENVNIRKTHYKEVNHLIIISWDIISFMLLSTYLIEVFKHERTISYYCVYFLVNVIPLICCTYRYKKKPDDENFSKYVVCGYFIMYTFVVLTGKTSMVFCYILPMLSFAVLFHNPNIILYTGCASLILNIFSIAQRVIQNELILSNSRDAEIQLGLIVFCFAGAYVSSKMYDKIIQDHVESTKKLVEQRSAIQSLENDVQSDRLTGLSSRIAYEAILEKLADESKNGVIFCDVNALKYINDYKGHRAGDQHLCNLADLLRIHFRKDDCFRISGDEFVVIISGLAQDVFEIRAKRFYDAIWMADFPIAAVGWDYHFDINEAIKNAEVKMYVDKQKFYDMYPKYKR